MSNAAVNICVQVFVWTHVFKSPGYKHRSGTAGSSAAPSLTFEELPDCFPRRLHHFTFQLALSEGSNSSTSWPGCVIIYLFYSTHPSGCEVHLSVVLICFPSDWWCPFLTLLCWLELLVLRWVRMVRMDSLALFPTLRGKRGLLPLRMMTAVGLQMFFIKLKKLPSSPHLLRVGLLGFF